MEKNRVITCINEKKSLIWRTILYFVVYIILFFIVENRNVDHYYVIYHPIDDKIPFISLFIIPYISWFFYIGISFYYFIFMADIQEYRRVIKVLFGGMISCLIFYLIWPNCVELRPGLTNPQSLWDSMVLGLHQIDTPTNVFPSIHVFATVLIHRALSQSRRLQKNKWILRISLAMTVMICASTVFLKQHSILDLIAGGVYAELLFQVFYRREGSWVRSEVKND